MALEHRNNAPRHEEPHEKKRNARRASRKSSRRNNTSSVIIRHEYHDHAHDDIPDNSEDDEDHPPVASARGGVTNPFPVKLFRMLAAVDEVADSDGDYASMKSIVSWQPHGRCFLVRNPGEFAVHIMPKYMSLTKLASFQRQLNLYGFRRITRGPDRGGYYHELFLRGKFGLIRKMVRSKIKGTGVRGRSDPDSEPDFWSMEWMDASSKDAMISASSDSPSVSSSSGSDDSMSVSAEGDPARDSNQKQQHPIHQEKAQQENHDDQPQDHQGQDVLMNMGDIDPIPVATSHVNSHIQNGNDIKLQQITRSDSLANFNAIFEVPSYLSTIDADFPVDDNVDPLPLYYPQEQAPATSPATAAEAEQSQDFDNFEDIEMLRYFVTEQPDQNSV